VPIVAIFGVTAALGLTILLAGRKRAEASPVAESPLPLPQTEAEREFGGDEADPAEAGCCQMGPG
jgi:hypothetical protein